MDSAASKQMPHSREAGSHLTFSNEIRSCGNVREKYVWQTHSANAAAVFKDLERETEYCRNSTNSILSVRKGLLEM